MKKLLLSLLLFCLAELGFSQTDFKKGYLITHDGDSIFGFVNYKEGYKANEVCKFKRSETSDMISYQPNDIIGYGFIKDKFFLSKEFVEKDQPSKVIFFEVIVHGLISLYKFGNTFFIQKQDDDLKALINTVKETYVGELKILRPTNQHIITLNTILFDCSELRERIQKVSLNEKSLAKLIEDYNSCKGVASLTYKADKPWITAVVGLGAGINISTLEFSPYYPGYQYLIGSFETSRSPTVSVSLDLLSPRISKRAALHAGLIYAEPTYHLYGLVVNMSSTVRNYAAIELKEMKIPVSFRYTFTGKKVAPYFDLGILNVIHLSSHSAWTQEIDVDNVVATYTKDSFNFKTSQFGMWGGLGIQTAVTNKLNAFMEFRYEQTDGIFKNSNDLKSKMSSKIVNVQIILGLKTK